MTVSGKSIARSEAKIGGVESVGDVGNGVGPFDGADVPGSDADVLGPDPVIVTSGITAVPGPDVRTHLIK